MLVATNSNITAKPSEIGEPDGVSTRNVIGRSAYSGDLSFKGAIRDFRIYGRALDAGDAATLSAKTSTAATTADKAALTLGDTSAVTANLTLPAKGSAGSTITWASSVPATVSSAGVVHRPAHGAGNAAVTLTATITHGAVSTTKDFQVTVLEDELDDAAKVQAALAAIELVHPDDVRGNLTLPTKGASGTALTWASSKPGVVTSTGEVTRPAHGADPVDVTLTATGKLNSTTGTRDLVVTVKPAPAALDLKAYAFAYFAGESTDDGEKIYMGASKGNDPMDYDELNDGKPVLASQFGTKGLRDPFIIRSHEGDRFYLLATDLKAYPAVDFGKAQQTGSKYLEIWESTDLVHWSNQRHVKVSSDFAGNTWAPESYYDENTGEYVVYWASALYPTTEHRRPRHQHVVPADDVRHDPRLRDVQRPEAVDRRQARHRQGHDRRHGRQGRRHVLSRRQGRGVHDPAPGEVDRPARHGHRLAADHDLGAGLAARQGEARPRSAQPVGRHVHRRRGPDGLPRQQGSRPLDHVHRPAQLSRRPGLHGVRDARHRVGGLDGGARRGPAQQPAARHGAAGDAGRARPDAAEPAAGPARRVGRAAHREHQGRHCAGAARQGDGALRRRVDQGQDRRLGRHRPGEVCRRRHVRRRGRRRARLDGPRQGDRDGHRRARPHRHAVHRPGQS